jgi:hypothetical protein
MPYFEPSRPMPDSFTPPMGQPLTIEDSALAQGPRSPQNA